MERKLHTLVEDADQLEGSTPVEDGDEEERLVCPVCGEIFNQSSYKVIVHSVAGVLSLLVLCPEKVQESQCKILQQN